MSDEKEDIQSLEEPEKKASVLSKIKLAAIAIILVLTVIVIFQNTDSVTTKILFMTLEMPRAVLLILTFLLGAAVGVLFAFIRSRKHRE